MTATIRTAYTVSTKNGTRTYRVRAYVSQFNTKHTRVVALGDTLDEAMADALRYIRDQHVRDDMPTPTEQIDVGRVAGTLLDAYVF